MKVIMVGTERKLYEEGSTSRARIIAYGSLVEELHVIVLTREVDHYRQTKIAHNVMLYPTNSKSRFLYPFDVSKMVDLFKNMSIDLVSAQDPFESGLGAYFLSKKLNTKLHLQVHTDFLSPYFRSESIVNMIRVKIGTFLLKKADCVRVVSRRIADSIKKAHIVLRKEPIVLPIFVDLEKFIYRERGTFLKRKYPQFEETILMVNRLEREKNPLLALRIFASVAADFPKTGLIIVGSGSLKNTLISEVSRLHLGERVCFEGWQDDTAPYYQSATVFFSTSNYEGYGVSLIEAACSHLPIVTTDIGIARELLQDDGVFIGEVGDKESLSACLKKALSSKEEREKYVERAQSRVRQYLLSDEDYFNRYRQAWEQCLT